MNNTYTIFLKYYTEEMQSYEIKAESDRKAIITLLELQTDENNIQRIEVSRLK